MRKIILSSLLLALPFLLLFPLEIFVFRIDAFTFRPWEALRYVGATDGFFYENIHLKTTEYGIQYRYGQINPPRHNEWWTDRFGFRNRPQAPDARYDIVVVGDSNIVGSYLDQSETIAEVLA